MTGRPIALLAALAVSIFLAAPLPAMYQLKEAVDRGGLMSYGASLPDLGRRAAFYVD